MFICTSKPFAFRIAPGSPLGNLARNPCFVAFCVSFVLERFRRALTLLFFGLPFTVEGVEFLHYRFAFDRDFRRIQTLLFCVWQLTTPCFARH